MRVISTILLISISLYLHGQSVQDHLKKGLEHYANYAQDSALFHFENAYLHCPDSALEDKTLITYYLCKVLRKVNQKERAFELMSENVDKVQSGQIANDTLAGMIVHEFGKLHEVYLNDFAKAMKFYQRAFGYFKDYEGGVNKWAAVALTDIGYMHLLFVDMDSALHYQNRALKITRAVYPPYHREIGFILSEIGGIHFYKGNYTRLRETIAEIIKIFERQEVDMRSNLSILYSNVCQAEVELGNFHKAIEYANHSRSLQKELNVNDNDVLAYLAHQTGMAYLGLKNYKQAEKYFIESIEISGATNSGINKTHAEACTHLAGLYMELGRYEEGFERLDQSMHVLEQIFKERGASSKLSVYRTRAQAYQKMGDHAKAANILKDIIELDLANVGLRHRNSEEAYLNLGRLAKSEGLYDQAMEYYDKSRELIPLDFTQTMVHPDHVLLDIFLAQAECQVAKFDDTGDVQSLHEAYKRLRTADSIVFEIQKGQQNYEDKIHLLEGTEHLYNQMVKVLYRLNETVDHTDYTEEIYHFFNRSKFVLLQEHLNNTSAQSFGYIPDSLIADEADLKFEISYNKSQLQNLDPNDPRSSEPKVYEDKIFILTQRLEKLRGRIERDYPKYYNLKYSNESASIGDVQALLRKDDLTMVEYFVGSDDIYAFVITKDTFNITEIPRPKTLVKTVENFNGAINKNNCAEFGKISYGLYETLISPIKPLIAGSRVILVPDGVLWYLNFDLLISKGARGRAYGDMDFLIKDYTFSYAYSSTLLLEETNRISESQPQSKVMAFSYGQGDFQGNQLSLSTVRGGKPEDLPGSRKEIRLISEVFEGDYYYGSFASESNFKSRAGDYAFLHLAVHGEINEQIPENSLLYFATADDSEEDGHLYTHELYNMQLNAELAVLSACNTGSGKLIKGEGIMSLGRAFTYAGCKSLVLTLWELNDAVAPNIMKTFYNNLYEGMDKADALRSAKLTHLKSGDNITKDPYFWGSLVLVGDYSPVSISTPFPKILYVIIGVFVVVVVFFGVNRKRNNPVS